jgi:hypothetical protein
MLTRFLCLFFFEEVEMRRDCQIGVRVTAAELAKVDSLAAATERDRSKVIRLLLSQALARETPDLALAPDARDREADHA